MRGRHLNTLEAVLVGGDDHHVVLIAGATRFELARNEIAWIQDAPPSGRPAPREGIEVVVVLSGAPHFLSCRRLVRPQNRTPFSVATRAASTPVLSSERYRSLEREYLSHFGLLSEHPQEP